MNLVKLIEAVKRQSNIYKNLHVDDEEYGKEWEKVAKDLQVAHNDCCVTAEEAQDQWNQVLLEYMEYLRGNQDFALAKHMDFLQPYLFTILEDDVDEEELSHILADDGSVIEATSSNKVIKAGEICRTNATNPEKPTQDAQNAHLQVKQEIVLAEDTAAAQEQNTFPATAAPPAQNKITQNDTSFSNLSSIELIFLGYAKQLQKMPLALQLQTKRKIADVMDEAELKMMEAAM